MTTRHHIIGGEIVLYRIALQDTPTILESVATVPTPEGTVYIHHWQINDTGTKVHFRYSMTPDLNAAILDGEFPCRAVETPADKPRGKNWRWSYGAWERNGGTERRLVC
jgi:hypothetical protein